MYRILEEVKNANVASILYYLFVTISKQKNASNYLMLSQTQWTTKPGFNAIQVNWVTICCSRGNFRKITKAGNLSPNIHRLLQVVCACMRWFCFGHLLDLRHHSNIETELSNARNNHQCKQRSNLRRACLVARHVSYTGAFVASKPGHNPNVDDINVTQLASALTRWLTWVKQE